METSTALGNVTQMPSVQGLLWRGEIFDKKLVLFDKLEVCSSDPGLIPTQNSLHVF